MKNYIFILLFGVISGTSFAGIVADFDRNRPEEFVYKDDKGSGLNVAVFFDEERNRYVGMKYNIVRGGWAGWGIMLKKLNVSSYEFLSFYIKGEKGNEKFDFGLKDTKNKELKLSSSKYFDVTPTWQKVKISLSEFDNVVDLTSLENFNIGFNETSGKGTIFIDDIQFEGSRKIEIPIDTDTEIAETVSQRRMKVLVDGFERVNPYDFYKVLTGDESSLKLTSSRLVHKGDYSMEMEYEIITNNPLGSWVSARWDTVDVPLDWTGAEEVEIYVKSDGNENIFRINIVDKDGELWSCEDLNILKSTKWEKVSFRIEEFFLCERTSEGNGKLDLDKIYAYEISIRSKFSGRYVGKIYVDQFSIHGVGVSPVKAVPPKIFEKLRVAIPTVGNIDFSGMLYTEYFTCPEEKQKIFHWGKIIANGKVDNYSARIEFASISQPFNEAAVVRHLPDGRIITETRSPGIIVPSVSLLINNPFWWMSNVNIGNIWFNYSKYTFTIPGWGWKGATFEGDIGRFNYHMFYINQSYDSFIAGTRWISYFPEFKLIGYYIHSYQSARIQNTGRIVDGILNPTSEWVLKPISKDNVYCLQLWKWFFARKMEIEIISAFNEFFQYATADYTNPFYPVYNQELKKPVIYSDTFYLTKIELNELLFRGLRISCNYRYAGKEFKPQFRENPSWFDDSEADQKGYNIRLSQWYKGLQFSVEYDNILRLSNSEYFRYFTVTGIGYYGFRRLDIAYFYSHRRDKYKATSTRSSMNVDRDEIVNANEVYVRTQLTPKTAVWFKVRRENFTHLATNFSGNTDSLFTKLEYYITPNARLFGEYKVTRYFESHWEPHGWPFDDNFGKIAFELSF